MLNPAAKPSAAENRGRCTVMQAIIRSYHNICVEDAGTYFNFRPRVASNNTDGGVAIPGLA